MKKEIEEDIRRWKDLPCSGIRRINIVNMAILPKEIEISMHSSYKFEHSFHRSWMDNFTIIYSNKQTPKRKKTKQKNHRIATKILNDNWNPGGLTVCNFKFPTELHYKNLIVWHKNRYPDQWNWIEGQHINTYGHMIFDLKKKARNTYWKRIVSSKHGAGLTGCLHLDPWL